MFSNVVKAREEFGYFGEGGGATFLEDKDDAFDDIDKESTVIKTYIGYRASTYIAFELEYAYMGEYNYTQGSLEDRAELSTLTASIVVMYPLVWDDFELYTPIGISGDVTVFETEGTDEDRKQNLSSAYASLQYNF